MSDRLMFSVALFWMAAGTLAHDWREHGPERFWYDLRGYVLALLFGVVAVMGLEWWRKRNPKP